MSARIAAITTLLAAAACAAQTAPSPAPAPGASMMNGAAMPKPDRSVRRDVPITNKPRNAFAAGTRDSTGRPGANYWQQRVDYNISARLDPSTSVVTGHESITIHNNSDSTLSLVALRLDQNFFTPRASRLDVFPPSIEITDGMKVTRIVANGEEARITDSRPRQRPTTATAIDLDNTVGVVFLGKPIPAKGTGTLEIDWSFKVPEVTSGRGQRMGRQGDTLYQVAQWYPRVAVYDDLVGWNADQYLGSSEFYNNFGTFDVGIDVPAGWLVGATGVLQNPSEVLSATTRERLSHVLESDARRTIVGASEQGAGRATAAGDRLVWRFHADTVGDFAWSTSSKFVWDATRATIPGRGAVPVNLLYLPGNANNYRDADTLARHALEFYSSLWMPYEFPQLTLSDGPELGMEYPMFIMSARGAADHETGHEWWPMMLGTNETWYGWMDEGFNQYMNILSSSDRMHRAPPLDGLGQAYGRISGNEIETPMMSDANHAGQLYSFTTYGKAPQMLSMLGGIVGDSAVQRAMSEYAKAWRFKHPSPWDYMFFMNNALGRDLGWFWYYWLFTTDAVDGSIQGVTTSGSQTTVAVRQDGQMPSPVVLQVEFAPSGPALRLPSNARMVNDSTAIVTWPVDVWFGGSKTFNAVMDFGGRAVTKVQLDPHRRFPDNDPRDNAWPR